MTCPEEKGLEDRLMSDDVVSDVGNLESNLEMPQADHAARLNGHHGPQQKSSRTRIMRMDYGLGSFTKALEGPILGKRVSEQNSNLSFSRAKMEAQKAKCEKLSSCFAGGYGWWVGFNLEGKGSDRLD